MSVVPFPGTNWRDIPALAREFADDVEAGKYGDISRIAMILETGHGAHTIQWGESASPLHVLGMYQAAGMMAFAEAMEEE